MRLFFALLLSAIPAVAAEPPITAIAFAPDGKEVIVGSQSGVRVLSWPELKAVRTVKTELSHVHDLAFSSDGKMLAVGGGSPGERGTVELITWPEEKLVHQLSPHQDLVYSIAWASDCKRLATASADRTIIAIDIATGKSTTKLEGHSRPVLAVAFLPGDTKLVSSGVDGTLRLWDVATSKVEKELSYHTKPVNGLAVQPSKEKSGVPVLASLGDDKTVRIWQPTVGRMVRLARLTSEPLSMVWNREGSELIVACKDGSLRIVDPEAVDVRSTILALEGNAYSLALAADGSVLVGGGNGQLKRIVLKK